MGYDLRKAYVYRQLEKLVDTQRLTKEKVQSTRNKPNYDQTNFDLEQFQVMVDERPSFIG